MEILTPRRGHYAWIILALCFVALLAAQGVRLTFGAFIQPWEREFAVDRGTISFVSLLSFLVYGITQPMVGRLVDRYGVRRVLAFSVLVVGVGVVVTALVQSVTQLAIVYGVIASLGFGGASGVVASVAVTNWFHTRRGLAFGLVEAGFAAGQLVLVPTSLVLIEAYGWRHTMVAIGGITGLVIFPLVLLFLRSSPREVNLRPYGAEATEPGAATETTPAPAARSTIAVFRTRAFWGLAFPFFICGITTTGMMDTHLIAFAHDHGYSTVVTGATVSLLAAFNILGTVASGPLADRWDSRQLLGALYAVRALAMVLLLTTHHPHWLLAFGIVFGLVNFATVAPTQLLVTQYFAGHSVGYVFGLISLAHQLGSAFGAYVPGVLYDLTGSYTVPFVAGVVVLVLAAGQSLTLPQSRARGAHLAGAPAR